MTIELPHHRIIEKLGVGARSRLYRARCIRTGRDYTIKYVVVDNAQDLRIVDQLRAEHEIGAAVVHPAVRKVYALRMLRKRFRVRGAMLIMEYVDGAPLSDKDRRDPDEVLRLFTEVANGLNAMHLAGFVHADLKPGNILVNTQQQVKLIDLGQSARRHEAKTRIQGTIHYMAPEQVERGTLDQRTDVFGLGATLHRVLTGRPVATGMNQTVSLHAQGLVGKRMSQINGGGRNGLAPPIARLIADCCAEDPADRPDDMPAVIMRIELARAILAKHIHAGDHPPADPADDSEDDILDSIPDDIAAELEDRAAADVASDMARHRVCDDPTLKDVARLGDARTDDPAPDDTRGLK
ncbi:MAG: serine/threonine-protein kinase [Phycisphaerae bacterium]